MDSEAIFTKDPNEVLDYKINWEPYLNVRSETISTSAWEIETPGSGLTIDDDSSTTLTTTVWVSGGTLKKEIRLRNRITTSGGRTADRSIIIKIVTK